VDFPQKYPTRFIEVKWKTRVANKVKEPWQGKPRDLVLVQHGRNHSYHLGNTKKKKTPPKTSQRQRGMHKASNI